MKNICIIRMIIRQFCLLREEILRILINKININNSTNHNKINNNNNKIFLNNNNYAQIILITNNLILI